MRDMDVNDAIDEFVDGYVECAFWCTTDWPEHGEPTGNLDQRCDEFAEDAMDDIRSECTDFVESNEDDLRAAVEQGRPWGHLGHDFMLSRNGHGTGYWDRGLGELGDRLDEATKPYGETNYWADENDIGQVG